MLAFTIGVNGKDRIEVEWMESIHTGIFAQACRKETADNEGRAAHLDAEQEPPQKSPLIMDGTEAGAAPRHEPLPFSGWAA
jgi:hypothetical protein